MVQQIFWNRIAASLTKPNDAHLYLNTLFSLTSPKNGYTLEFLMAVLNSRVLSACYGRWANRLFGDKFPKVSKVDLARIPMPRPSVELNRKLTKLGTQLSQEWTGCKEEYQSFKDYLNVTDTTGNLAKKLAKPWNFTHEQAVAAVGEAKLQLSQREFSALMDSWSDSFTTISNRWDKICEYEEEVDRLVLRAYGFPKAIYSELIERAPSCSLDDILLPQ